MLELFDQPWQEVWQHSPDGDPELGAVFTKPEVVALILDMAGYTADSTRLATKRVLEPSCGDGAFLSEVLDRLIRSELVHCPDTDWESPELLGAIRAVDLNRRSLASACGMMRCKLVDAGCPPERANQLAECWTEHRDFLLGEFATRFDFVIGNPPYVRIEDVPRSVLREYRARFSTLSHRADLYIAFIERGLNLLAEGGVLAYICANRFAKNQYGAGLRSLIASKYHVRYYLNLEHTQPFQADVAAYPAIVVVDEAGGGVTRAGTLTDLERHTLSAVRAELSTTGNGVHISLFPNWYPDGGAWVTTSLARHRQWTNISVTHPTLEASGPGTRIGIGVATGADKVFILSAKADGIEESRQIPLVLARDIRSGGIEWSGKYLLNPFVGDDSAELVDLAEFPGLALHLRMHAESLLKRHVAKARPKAWYRTIDKITVSLRTREKLLLPDIQRGGVVGYDPGDFYPHHNLYWITSDSWDLRALQALLRSHSVREQVEAYSVQMMHGALRYQAQTLKKIRVPSLVKIPDELMGRLAALGGGDDQKAIDEAAAEAFTY